MRKIAKAVFAVSLLLLTADCFSAFSQVLPQERSVLSFEVGGARFSMVWVEGGSYVGYDGKEKSVEAFSIGECEVTQALYMAVMGLNPSTYKGLNYPQEWVRYSDCKRFIGILRARTGMNFRLPSETEWEWAARGGLKSKGYAYSGSDDSKAVAWTKESSGGHIHAVSQKQPNELGIYDMSGGVAEWVEDVYELDVVSSAGKGSDQYHVIRGGSWYSSKEDATVTSRSGQGRQYRSHWVGFRLAL